MNSNFILPSSIPSAKVDFRTAEPNDESPAKCVEN